MTEHVSLDGLDQEPHAEVFEDPNPRTVRLQLDAGERMPPHTHPGMDIVFHLVSGRLELTVGEDTYDLRPGDLVQFSGEREISPRAVDPSTAVVVFAPSGTDQNGA